MFHRGVKGFKIEAVVPCSLGWFEAMGDLVRKAFAGEGDEFHLSSMDVIQSH